LILLSCYDLLDFRFDLVKIKYGKERSAMKKIFFSIVLLLLNSTVSFANTSIRITNGEWEPFLSEYSYEYGLASHIISKSFKIEGIKVKWGFFPWKRSHEIAKLGLWDASATWTPTEERKKDFWISDTVINISYVFFYLKGNNLSWKNLKGRVVGLSRGYTYGREIKEFIEANELLVDITTKDEQNYQRLLNGRIDLFPNEPIVGYAQIRHTFTHEDADRFTHYPKAFDNTTSNLIISKKCKNGQFLLNKFNSGLNKLKKSGQYDQMFMDLDSGKYDKQQTKWK
jgi:polar amino acid transport system substrate-binding protein